MKHPKPKKKELDGVLNNSLIVDSDRPPFSYHQSPLWLATDSPHLGIDEVIHRPSYI